MRIKRSSSVVLTGEKKKTKAIDSDLNPVWNEVSAGLELAVMCKSYSLWICMMGIDKLLLPEFKWLFISEIFVTVSSSQLQVLEFDLKGSSLDASSFINLVVKDYETIGKDKYVYDKHTHTHITWFWFCHCATFLAILVLLFLCHVCKALWQNFCCFQCST